MTDTAPTRTLVIEREMPPPGKNLACAHAKPLDRGVADEE